MLVSRPALRAPARRMKTAGRSPWRQARRKTANEQELVSDIQKWGAWLDIRSFASPGMGKLLLSAPRMNNSVQLEPIETFDKLYTMAYFYFNFRNIAIGLA